MSPPTDIMLTDQVAVVTGGGGGIGQGCCFQLSRYGAKVVVLDIEPVRCRDTAEAIRARGGEAMEAPCDVMDAEALRLAIRAADERFGRIDILVNNAGGVSRRPFLEQSERSWRKHIDINFMSMLTATHEAAPIMIRGGRGGSIVNVSSIEGNRAGPNVAVYSACKAGMIQFTRSMALELSQHKIRVNGIAPDKTITPGNQGNRTGKVDPSKWIKRLAEVIDARRRVVPLMEEGTIEQCGDAAVFLSSKMAEYITGVTLPVDGGTWASCGWIRGKDLGWTQNEGLAYAAGAAPAGTGTQML